jgi:17beta-estradiol 17-dehydrogenase/3alpha(17beta)-hydroxysteroid dehydrogenase (NAD+)
MLSGKLCLVTGGASGIGLSISKLFAKEGAAVCIADINKEIDVVAKQLPNEHKQSHSAFACDVSNSNDVKALFKNIKECYTDFKFPRIVVNSAGITRDKTLLKLSEAEFDKVIDVNLKGTFLVTQAAAAELVAYYKANKDEIDQNKLKTYGSIINIASIVGKRGNLGQANYSASKAGVEGFTKSVSKEIARYNIRCNAILPGFIRTPMTERGIDYFSFLLKGFLFHFDK